MGRSDWARLRELDHPFDRYFHELEATENRPPPGMFAPVAEATGFELLIEGELEALLDTWFRLREDWKRGRLRRNVFVE